jgi:phospholipase C
MLIITYDEHGGFYDHVIPPIAELRKAAAGGTNDRGPFGPTASTASAAALLTDYGLRVPAFVVSPWVSPGRGPDIVLDHCSILKTILARFCADSKPFLSDRVDASQTFDAYLSESSPRTNVPPPPPLAKLPPEVSPTPASPSRITTAPITRNKMLTEGVEFNDLTGMYARLLLGR